MSFSANNEFIDKYPRQSTRLFVLLLLITWQSIAALIGFVIYLIVRQKCKSHLALMIWIVLAIMIAILAYVLQIQASPESLRVFFIQGIYLNMLMIKTFFEENASNHLFHYLYILDVYYFYATSIFTASVLLLTDLIPNSAHENALLQLKQAKMMLANPIHGKKIKKALKKIIDTKEGIILGVSTITAKQVMIPYKYINQIALVLGTTGAGKTITLQRFYQFAVKNRWPLIIIDGKPTSQNIQSITTLAKQYQRPCYVFNSAPFHHYNCLAHGGYTELKDKIISLKDEWSSDYYRSIAEDYLQTTFEILLNSGKPFELKDIVQALDLETLALMVRESENPNFVKHIERLMQYDKKDITGLQAHLSLLVNSELGRFFEINQHTFCLRDAFKENAIIYFALPALKFPTFAKVLGKLIINDLKTVIGSDDWHQKVFAVFDEFSVFAGEQVLNLINMGRGKGLHAIFGTQGLADLESITPVFKSQVLNCVNTIICHRLNDQDSAESVSIWAGTEDVFDVTAQVTSTQSRDSMGSVRKNKAFIIHPDDIKRNLKVGEAFYVTKVDGFMMDKVQVKYS